MAVSHAEAIQWLPRAKSLAESLACTIGLITLRVKQIEKRSAGNPHAAFDVAGTGNGFTVKLVRHRQTKETEQIGFTYGTPRQSSTLHLSRL